MLNDNYISPLVSVIIPAFNAEDSIERAIVSVLDQIYSHIEVIVINDGSTDRTSELIAKFATQVKVIEKKNGGVADARNAGINCSSGDWVAFLDADDYWLPNRLMRALTAISNEPAADFLHSGFVHENIGGARSPAGRTLTEVQLAEKEILMTGWLLPTSAVMVKRSLVERVGRLFNSTLKTCEDYEFFWRVLSVSKGIIYQKDVDVVHVSTPNSLSRDALGVRRTNTRELLRDNVRAMAMAETWISNNSSETHLGPILGNRKQWRLRELFLLAFEERSVLNLWFDVKLAIKYSSSKCALKSMLSALREILFK